jgi:endonuclease/exonuclease/phosphatase family metal-dependent hydrolase
MMRETLTAGSKHAFMLVSPGQGLAFQRRPSTGGLSEHTSGGNGTAPRWVKIERRGSTFTAYRSTDGVSWTTVGSETMNMTDTIYVGLAVGSHVDGDRATATFDGVTVSNSTTSSSPPPPPPSTSGTTLRVLQWNTSHGGRRTDGVYDPDNLVNWIVRMNPHVASLNEVDDLTKANRIVSLLESKTGVNWNSHWDARGNLLVTKLPVDDRDICVVNASAGRKSTFMTVRTSNGRTVSIYASHLSLSATERNIEVPALQACARNKVQGRILAGDYNMQAGSAAYNLSMEGHTDAWKKAKELGGAINYPGNCDGCTRNSRIDYVFTSTGASYLVLQSAQIYDTRNSSGVAASDHKPMVVAYAVR